VADDSEYTSAFSCELVRLGPGDHSLTHVEDYNHLLFFVEGSGEITIGREDVAAKCGVIREGQGRREALAPEPRGHRDADLDRVRPTARACVI
jgi:hypothetical protein